jgi:putative ABC transport system ATP-binding protein
MVRVDGNGSGSGKDALIRVRDLDKRYQRGSEEIHVLQGLNLDVEKGDFVAFMGPSGSGKTTLLNLLGGLDRPTAGSVLVDGIEVSSLGVAAAAAAGRRTVAFIFQSFGLIPILSAAENVEIPLRLVGAEPRERDRRVSELLELVGLGARARHRPHELSGGEQQRVAIARALANRPRLLLADEPTGQLDSETGKQIMRLLRAVVQSEGVTALVATHDPTLMDIADSVLHLADGAIQAEG